MANLMRVALCAALLVLCTVGTLPGHAQTPQPKFLRRQRPELTQPRNHSTFMPPFRPI
jgi:hypothetical protein